MSESARDPDVRALARALAGRSEADGTRLARRFAGLAWPAGADGTVPSAREWVRRWGPPRHPAERMLPVCACAEGHCTVCN